MPISILMPALSPTMESGKLAAWHVKAGDKITAGDVIAEIETDKAVMEVEAVEDGTIGKILIEADTDGVAVNTPIALLLEEGEAAEALDGFTPQAAIVSPPPEPQAPAAPPAAAMSDIPSVAAPAPVAAETAPGKRLFASPLARRLAAQNRIDLSQLVGSGPKGRIVKADVEAAMSSGSAIAAPTPELAAAPAPAPAAAPMDPNSITALYEPGSFTEVPLDNMRATIARRLTEAKRDVPHYYLSMDCNIDALLSARKRLNERLDVRISVNDFIIRAAALALMQVPDANAAFAGDRLIKFHHADISMAVAIDGGLITPIIRRAESKSLSEIAVESKALVEKAKSRKLLPQDYQGGSFSVSNLGMFGINNFTAVINPPQAAILAVGAGEKRAVVADDGSIAAATVMSVTLSCDHRVIDGALGARLLGEFKTFIEDPVMMLA